MSFGVFRRYPFIRHRRKRQPRFTWAGYTPPTVTAGTVAQQGALTKAPELFAARYNDVDYSGTSPVESFQDVADVGMRWSIAGGLQRLEVTVRARSDFDAWDRYTNHLGHRIAVYDQYVDRYIAGTVYEVVPNDRLVTYVCGGPWKRTADDYYELGDFPGSGDTDAIIKDILTDSVAIVDSDQSNIDASSVAIGAWTPLNNQRQSKPAKKAIEELVPMGDSSNNAMDFYLVDQAFNGVKLQKPLAYFKSRSTTASPDWQFERADLSARGLSLSRSIWELRRNIWIGAGRISGTDDGAGSRANLEDSTASFTNGDVSVGDRVVNITQGKSFTIDTITSGTVLDMNNEDGSNWTNGDQYTIEVKQIKIQNTGTSTESDLWSVYYPELRREMDATQAGVYGDQILATYEKPVQQQAFVLSSPTIRDGGGTRWPLWRPLMGSSFYFRITDLFPEAAVFGASDDRQQTFLVVAMDYTYRDNRLRIVPSTNDTRLDVLMSQALAEKRDLSQIVSTATGR
jgi:hypothetical protein